MNDLNSIILEGVLADDPIINDDIFKFILISNRDNESDQFGIEKSFCEIESIKKFSKIYNYKAFLKKNTKIRIIGHIHQTSINDKMIIIAEYIEPAKHLI